MNRSSCAFLACLGLAATILSGCFSNSSSSGNPGGGNGSIASFAPQALAFEPQALMTTSPPETTTVTNAGTAMMNITSVALGGTDPGDFAISSNSCGASLAPSATCQISITFTPTAGGGRSASLVVTDDAKNSPQSLHLAGTGSGGGVGPNCIGAPLPQPQTDVTSQLSFVASGVTVTQLTANGCNRFYYFDVPAFSASANRILYTNFESSSGNSVMSANPDGTAAAVLSSSAGNQLFLTGDSLFAYYSKPIIGGTPNGSDIFGGFLSANPFTELQITNLDAAPTPPLAVWEISTSSPDPSGGYDIAFSFDTLFHEVHVLANGTAQLLPTLTFNDPESTSTFHRLRVNPKFPNIVMYKRNVNGGAGPELWLLDLNSCSAGSCSASDIVNVVANIPGPASQSPKAGHIIWSPDGLDIGFSEPDIADYWLAKNVVTSTGTLNLTNGGIPASQLLELGPIPQIGTSVMTADYCVFPPDWPNKTVLACLAGPASPVHPATFYLMSSDGLGTTKLLAASDAQVVTIAGTPIPIFAQDDQHLLFNSDRPFTSNGNQVTGAVQLYSISGFTLTVP